MARSNLVRQFLRVDWVDFGHIYYYYEKPKPRKKKVIPTLNLFFSVSINEFLITRILVFDTHQTLFAVHVKWHLKKPSI
jgi:hypothetical protein